MAPPEIKERHFLKPKHNLPSVLVYPQKEKCNVGREKKDYWAERYNTKLGKEFLKLKFARARSFGEKKILNKAFVWSLA